MAEYLAPNKVRVIGRVRHRPSLPRRPSGDCAPGGAEWRRRCVRHWRWRSWPPRRGRPRTTSSREPRDGGDWRQGEQPFLLVHDLGRRTLRGLRFPCHEPAPRRHQQRRPHLRARPRRGTTMLVSRASGATGARGTAIPPSSPRSRPTGASSPSSRACRTCIPTTTTALGTCSCATCRRARPRSSAAPAARPARRATRSRTPRSRPTGASSPSVCRRQPAAPTTTTPRGRLRARPADGHDDAREPRRRRRRRQGDGNSSSPRSRPTGASSRSSPHAYEPRPDDTTRSRTSSCATCRRTPPRYVSRASGAGGGKGNGSSSGALDLGRRALRRLPLRCRRTCTADDGDVATTSSCATCRRTPRRS